MTRTVISVENLSKYYRLGVIGGATFREEFSRYWARKLGRPDPYARIGQADHGNRDGEHIWALRDVNLEVTEGEILGIIGRNGAGKSTLLKILSRITAPTSGRAVIRGRVGSLLEVGTGFHPELTGRENVYLNGTILGMTRAEVSRKLEEIVAFAEMDQFIDTPVKRYSSGMTVRLAFAVAAHLEPEILVVDEVLAVGDAAFQKKCLGKMGEVASAGRTILFVSHNMQAVQSLCTRCVMLSGGEVSMSGDPESIVVRYLDGGDQNVSISWEDPEGLGNGDILLKSLRVTPQVPGGTAPVFLSGNDIAVELLVWLRKPIAGLCVGFDLISDRGGTVLRSYDTDMKPEMYEPLYTGDNLVSGVIPGGLLNGGQYFVAPRIGIHNKEWIVNTDPLVGFEVTLSHGESPFWNVLNGGNRPGTIAPVLSWGSK